MKHNYLIFNFSSHFSLRLLIFSCLIALSFHITTVRAADYTAPATKPYAGFTFLDVAGTDANATASSTLDKLVKPTDGSEYLTYGSYFVNAKKFAWATFVSPNGSSTSGPATTEEGFFSKGASGSSSVGGNYSKIKTDEQTLTIYVTGTTSMAFLIKNSSSSKYLRVKISEVASNGDFTDVETLSSTLTSDALLLKSTKKIESSKHYKVFIDTNNGECRLYQIRFTRSSDVTLTYDPNGSEGTAVVESYAPNSTVTVKSNSFTAPEPADEYNFDGWNTKADGSGTAYTAGSTFSITANTTLYAQWSRLCTPRDLSVDYSNTTLFLDIEGYKTATPAITILSSGKTTTATAAGLTFESSNEVVATVGADGMVTAVGLGTTVITAKVTNDGTHCTFIKKFIFSVSEKERGCKDEQLLKITNESDGDNAKLTSVAGDGYEFDVTYKIKAKGHFDGSDNHITIEFKNGGTFEDGDKITVDYTTRTDDVYWVYGTSSAHQGYVLLGKTDGNVFTLTNVPAGLTKISMPQAELYDNGGSGNKLTEKQKVHVKSITITRYVCVGCGAEPTIASNSLNAVNSIEANNEMRFQVSARLATDNATIEIKQPDNTTQTITCTAGINEYSFTPTQEGTHTATYTVNGGGTCIQTATMAFSVTPDPCMATITLESTKTKKIVDERELLVPVRLGKLTSATPDTKYMLESVEANPISGTTIAVRNNVVELSGTPNVSPDVTEAAGKEFTIKIKVKVDGCSNITSFDIKVFVLPKETKRRIAYVVRGTKNGGFDNYTTGDADGTPLFDYLNTVTGDDGKKLFTVEATNCYATTDEEKILDFYSDYDVIILTDYPTTGEKDGNDKSYSNAIGCLIDKKPVLSFETFVADLPNWKLGTSAKPLDPEPVKLEMKLLCSAMEIFKDIDSDKLKNPLQIMTQKGVEVVNGKNVDKGLQGFHPVSAPDYMFIATVDGGSNGTLITCCERQVVMTARMILFGLNWAASKYISDDGKTIVKNMIEYLLIDDENLLADCSMTFDNGARDGKEGDHNWSNPDNWVPGRNSLPGPYNVVRIEQPCNVNVTDAHASMVDIKKGAGVIEGKTYSFNGSLTITPQGGLTVTGLIRKVEGQKFVTKYDIAHEDLVIQSSATGQGALAQGDKEGNTPATVEYYSRAYGANTTEPTWQYIGIPFSTKTIAIENFKYSWMCRWNENIPSAELGHNWEWVENEDQLFPFNGYCITQPSKKTYSLKGNLVASADQRLPLTRTEFAGNDQAGVNMLANSWMSPIDISRLKPSDFSGVDATIYIYNSGTYVNWLDNGTTSGYTSFVPGQFMTLPIGSAKTLGVPTIPPMQAFFVLVKSGTSGTLTLDYDILMYNDDHSQTTRPLHKPSMNSIQQEEKCTLLRISVFADESSADNVVLLQNSAYTTDFDNGYDGTKIAGAAGLPYLAVKGNEGDLSVAAIPELAGTRISFSRGDATEYTLHFNYEESISTPPLYLRDLITQEEVEIFSGNTYTFEATNTVPMERFEIISRQENTDVATSLADVCIHDGTLYLTNPISEEVDVAVYGADGKLLQHLRTHDRAVPITVPSKGVYLIQLTSEQGVRVVKQIL